MYVSQAIGSCKEMSKMELHGFVKAKQRGVVSGAQCRAILRMPWLLRLCHNAVNSCLEEPLNATGCKNTAVYTAGGTRGTNVADIGVTSQMIVVAGLDNRSCASLTSSDIQAPHPTGGGTANTTCAASRLIGSWGRRLTKVGPQRPATQRRPAVSLAMGSGTGRLENAAHRLKFHSRDTSVPLGRHSV